LISIDRVHGYLVRPTVSLDNDSLALYFIQRGSCHS
jgi:hypothetical protein